MSENTAKTAAEWVFVAKSVAQLPDGENPALRCMTRAGIAVEDVSDWVVVAKAWADTFNDSEMAQQCMSIVALVAKTSDGWELIAFNWNDLTHYETTANLGINLPSEEKRESIELFGEMANVDSNKTYLDWLSAATKAIIDEFDTRKALAMFSWDWIHIAEAWTKLRQESRFNSARIKADSSFL